MGFIINERIKMTALLLCLAITIVNCRVEPFLLPDTKASALNSGAAKMDIRQNLVRYKKDFSEPASALSDNIVSMEENKEDLTEIKISSESDLEELVKKSVDESYSKGKKFILTNDIDLNGKEFTPISLMAGCFDGNGHIITGIKIVSDKSENGFIRRVTESGTVENLTVSADITAGKITENIGGIAGENAGTISRTTFEGSILSYRASGGIAGHLAESGNIISCTNKAVITSQRRTGGIAGFNEGNISDCVNYGKINTGSETAHELLTDDSDKFELDLSRKDFRVLMTGGIAGINSGVIADSMNYGKVGFSSLGYLTGGIAGYTKGYIGNCINNADISGRKNTGGIAGLFEPYSRHVYENDSFDKAEDKADELTGLLDDLNGLVQAEDDSTQKNIDLIRLEIDALRYKISENKAYYRSKDDIVEQELEGRLDKIRATADDMDGDFSIAFSSYQGTTAKEEAESIEKLIRAFVDALRSGSYLDLSENLLKLAEKSRNFVSALNKKIDETKAAEKKISKESKKLIEGLEDLRDEFNELDDYCRNTADSYKCDLRNTSDDLNARVENIAAEMDILNEGLKSSDKKIRNKTDEISKANRELTDAVTDSFDEAKSVITELKDTEDSEEVFEDLSDDEDATVSEGLIHKCTNKATVFGNINTGGIAGTIDYWNESESESEIVSEGTPSLEYKSYKKATILDSENHADIVSSRDYSGGIVGKAASGAVIGCGNYGNLFSEDGKYSGGIAGYSAFTIRNCYAVTSVSADSEAGGIAGKGKNLINNRSIAYVSDDGEHKGAVAGSLEEGGQVSGNEFVTDDGSGINGAANSAEAKRKSYEEIVSGNNIPEAFKKLTVTFIYEGTVIKRLVTSYDSSLDESEIPKVPKKENKIGFWSRNDFDHIKENMLVSAEYESYVTSISAKADDTDYLLEGLFYPDSVLMVKKENDADLPEELRDYKIISKISLSVDSQYGTVSSDRLIRISDKNKADVIAVSKDGKVSIKDTRRDGSYIVADIGDASEIYIVRKKWLFWF